MKRKYTRIRQSKQQGPSLKLEPVIPNQLRINEPGTCNTPSTSESPTEVNIQGIPFQINISRNPLTFVAAPRKRIMMYDVQAQTDITPIPSREEIKSIRNELKSCQEIIKSLKEALLKMSPIFNIINVLQGITNHSHTLGNTSIPKSKTQTLKDSALTLREATNDINPSVENIKKHVGNGDEQEIINGKGDSINPVAENSAKFQFQENNEQTIKVSTPKIINSKIENIKTKLGITNTPEIDSQKSEMVSTN